MNTPRPARLRGHTRIELTDCRTGRRKIYEKDNLVTGALQEIFTPLGIYTDSNLLTPQGEGDAATAARAAEKSAGGSREDQRPDEGLPWDRDLFWAGHSRKTARE